VSTAEPRASVKQDQATIDAFRLEATRTKGLGLFATRAFPRHAFLFRIDLRQLPHYSLRELASLSADDNNHSDYRGRGRYAIDYSLGSYMNHSCDPSCYYHMRSITVKDVFTLRDLAAGDELTHDYAATAVDQFAGRSTWTLACGCGSPDCRGVVTGDFFAQPLDWQRRFYLYLAPSIKRKYRAQLAALSS
jgi:hypothetical protein